MMRLVPTGGHLRRGFLSALEKQGRAGVVRTKATGAKHTYECTGTGQGPGTTIHFGHHHQVRTDLPLAMGGKDLAPQPVELLLASLIGCEQATAVFVARHMKPRFKLGQIKFKYEAERDSTSPISLPLDAPQPCSPKLERIFGRASVSLAGGATETVERLRELESEVHRRCPVHRTLADAGVKFETEWVLLAGG
ncbi:OsmC-like protein [Chloropicon primus]|uniref:OsmC-like protein n=1 Tax=Chloropicon primus TaxID=1764295 RepID=A0A5B8MND9_9CHLO|nr:hypothetical protein A3770_04p33700 [Chloropicon primus]UPR00065.1 OsmC-like protein [Chloropicon primus]|eukprot:QDZ20852.1 hypothetical protein A3770_04p33700 [Chloropicon primus]